MKAYLIMHLLVPRSRSSAKVKVKYKGYISQKMAVSGAFVFHKRILFPPTFSKFESDTTLIGKTVCSSQSDVVLPSYASSYRKIWRTRFKTSYRMIGNYSTRISLALFQTSPSFYVSAVQVI